MNAKLASLSLFTLFGLTAAVGTQFAAATDITKAEYEAGTVRADAAFRTSSESCKNLSGNANDICVERAKGEHNTARAELRFALTGRVDDGTKLLEARAESQYSVAMEVCDDKAGNAKDVCVAEAKAAHDKALADVKLRTEVQAAGYQAAREKRDADYKVAIEKCDYLSGVAKDNCVASAKVSFSQ